MTYRYFQKGHVPWNKGQKMSEEFITKAVCTRALNVIKRQETSYTLKMRNQLENKYLYPSNRNPNFIIDIRL